VGFGFLVRARTGGLGQERPYGQVERSRLTPKAAARISASKPKGDAAFAC